MSRALLPGPDFRTLPRHDRPPRRSPIQVRTAEAPPVPDATKALCFRAALSKRDAGTYLGNVNENLIDRLIRQGDIGTCRIGGRIVIPVADLDEYVKRTRTVAHRG